MANNLKASLGWVGPRGYSAYETAVQHGFIGTEEDWLSGLGTSNHFDRYSNIYITTGTNESEFDLPEHYTSNSFIDVYVDGEHLDSEEYTIDTATNKIVLTTPLDVVGTKLEIITLTMSSNDFTEKFKILTGTMTMNEALEIPYPTGLNQTNCVAVALRGGNGQSNMGINYEPSNIVLFYEDTGAYGEVDYTVVLMRID